MIILGILRSWLVNQIILQLLGLCNTTGVDTYSLETNHKMVFGVLLKMYDPNSNSSPIQDHNLPSLVNVLGDDECHPRKSRFSEMNISSIQNCKSYVNCWKEKILAMDNDEFNTFYLEQECYPTVEEYVKIMSVLTSDDKKWTNDLKLSELIKNKYELEDGELVKRVLNAIC